MWVSETTLPLRFISHNIRYAASNLADGERPWPMRAPRVVTQLRFHVRHVPTAFICLQEVLHEQLQDVLQGLNRDNEEWSYIGVGRDDGSEAGEYSPIFFRPAIWSLKQFATLWLSPTPSVPSKGWDAGSIRLLTIGLFQHRETGQHLVVMNTHLDNEGSVAREEAAKIIIDEASRWMHEHSLPVVLTGDMNSTESQEAYQILTSKSSPFKDLKRLCNLSDVYGWKNTWTGFDGKGAGEGLKRIDFIFCDTSDRWDVNGHAVLDNCFDDSVYLSDHRAVVGDLCIRSRKR